MRRNNKNRKPFCVVQFIEIPFEEIANYVCVPDNWIILRKKTERNVVVAYPKEDPTVTTERVKKRERCDDDWKLYLATIKHESDTYKDAEDWIATKHEFGTDDEELQLGDPQPEPAPVPTPPPRPERKLRRPRNYSWRFQDDDWIEKPYGKFPRLPKISVRLQRLDTKILKPEETASARVDDSVSPTPGCSKQSSVVILDNQLIQSAQTSSVGSDEEQTSTEGIAQDDSIESQVTPVQSTSPKLTEEKRSPVHQDQNFEKEIITPVAATSVPSTSSKVMEEKQLLPVHQGQNSEQKIITPIAVTPVPSTSSKVTEEEQLSPLLLDQNYEQALSTLFADLKEFDGNADANQGLHPVLEEKSSCTIPSKTPEQAAQPVVEISPPVHETPVQEIRRQEVAIVQPSHSLPEANDYKKTQLHQLLTMPFIAPKPQVPANTSNQLELYESPLVPVTVSKPNPLPQIAVGDSPTRRDTSSTGLAHTLEPRSQKPRAYTRKNNTPSTQHVKDSVKISSQVYKRVIRIQSSTRSNKLPAKKAKLGDVTGDLSAMQHSFNAVMRFDSITDPCVRPDPPPAHNQLPQAPPRNYASNVGRIDQRAFLQNFVSTSAAQNLSNLAHQKRLEPRQHLPTQDNYLQQIGRGQDNLRSNMEQTKQKAYLLSASMGGSFITNKQPFNRPTRPENQCLTFRRDYMEEVIRQQLQKGRINEPHSDLKTNSHNVVSASSVAHNSSVSSQSQRKFEHAQKQPPNYQDACASIQTGMDSTNSETSVHQGVIVRTPPLDLPKSQPIPQRSYTLKDPRLQEKPGRSATKNFIDLAVAPGYITVEPIPATQTTDVQTLPRPESRPKTKKIMVDQATETDLIVETDRENVSSIPVTCGPSFSIDSSCQTDQFMEEGALASDTETAMDSDNTSDREVISDNDESDSSSERIPSEGTDRRPTLQNTPEQIESRRAAEQQILDVIGTLFTQIGANLSYTREVYHNLRNMASICAETYESLLKQVDKLNALEKNVPTSSKNVPSEKQKPHASNSDNATKVKHKLTLPPEYDPNDSKWTRKYRELTPNLVELLPRSGVYVKREALKKIIKEADNCRMLTRSLLTEVFSKNALSVCSLTGGKAKAFTSMGIPIRPGLDEHAKMVLLTFIEEHGRKRGWKTDLAPILSSIRTKIQDIREKYGRTKKTSVT